MTAAPRRVRAGSRRKKRQAGRIWQDAPGRRKSRPDVSDRDTSGLLFLSVSELRSYFSFAPAIRMVLISNGRKESASVPSDAGSSSVTFSSMSHA